jgi:hypothetical protein
MNVHLTNLMDKEVSRKEFLGMSALAIGSVFGLGTVIKLLTGKSLEGGRSISSGYGASAYGGSKESH